MEIAKTSQVSVTFLGGAGTVTGSKFLIETQDITVMIDCGMFQGLKDLRQLNWENLPVDVGAINMVLLTHAHLDHTGYLPRLVQQGFKGDIVGSEPTLAMTKIILEDSAHIQEEDAKRANKEQFTKHSPAIPFYNQKDVDKTLRLFKSIEMRSSFNISDTVRCRFLPVGHILGASFIEMEIAGKRLVFSGDVGRPNDYLLPDPEKPTKADYLFLESTYGDRLHETSDPESTIISLVETVIENQGTLIIPSFAVERLQTLMYLLWTLIKSNKIPDIPVYVDSPMGNKVLSVFERFSDDHKLSPAEFSAMCRHINIVQSYKETWQTIDKKGAKIVVAGSGMVTGGRVLTYLQQLIDREETEILLAGYQAIGTRGRQLQEGAHEVKIYGKYYSVKAGITTIDNLSAHADQSELLQWLDQLENAPEKVFLIHGEPASSDALRVKLETDKKWKVHIPKLHEIIHLHGF